METYSFTLDELRVFIATALAHKSVGDPFARDVKGCFRYNWFLEDAEKFLTIYKHKLNDKKDLL